MIVTPKSLIAEDCTASFSQDSGISEFPTADCDDLENSDSENKLAVLNKQPTDSARNTTVSPLIDLKQTPRR